MSAAVILLALVTAERLGELWLARRNQNALMQRGAIEAAREHYPFLVALHASWLACLWWFGARQPVLGGWLAVFLLLQVLRVWTLATLGRRWTTRIIILPGAALVRAGPYRFVNHPNYIVVIGEIAVLPLCLGLPWLALLFSLANGVLLTVRIRAENGALRQSRTTS